jgi:acyl carrier protein
MNDGRLDRVRRVVADIFDLELEQVTESSSPETTEAWDSLQHLNLVLALEQSFGVAFTTEEINQMLSVGEIVNVLRKKADGQS